MELQQEISHPSTDLNENSLSSVPTSTADERIQQFNQLLLEELAEASQQAFPLWGMWK